jgi:hypothetical protein
MGRTNRHGRSLRHAACGHGARLSGFLLLWLATQPAQAQNRAEQEREAKKACVAGDYAKGVSILSGLFADTNDPNYIFNGGRCFEQNGRYEEAILRFREYLRKAKNASKEDRSDVEKHIVDCQALMGKKDNEPAPAVFEPAKPPLTAGTAAEQGEHVAGAMDTTVAPGPDTIEQKAPPAPGSGLRIAGLVTLGVGAAALVTAVIFNLKANNLASELESTTTYERSKESSRAGYETLGWVGYGVGAACVAGGAALYVVGWNQGRKATSSVALLPAFSPDQVGAVLKGAF